MLYLSRQHPRPETLPPETPKRTRRHYCPWPRQTQEGKAARRQKQPPQRPFLPPRVPPAPLAGSNPRCAALGTRCSASLPTTALSSERQERPHNSGKARTPPLTSTLTPRTRRSKNQCYRKEAQVKFHPNPASSELGTGFLMIKPHVTETEFVNSVPVTVPDVSASASAPAGSGPGLTWRAPSICRRRRGGRACPGRAWRAAPGAAGAAALPPAGGWPPAAAGPPGRRR